MAKTFDPNRVRPGTIVLERADDGTYSSKIVGLESVNSLSLPEISTTAAVTKTDTDTKTATDITGDTVQKQTQMAFRTGDDNQIDTTGSMLQDEAKKTSSMLSDTFANTRNLMTSDDAYRGVDNRFDAETFDETEDKISIKDPTSTVFGRPRERTIDQAAIDRQTQKNLGLDQPEVRGSAAVQRGEIEPPGIDFSFLGGDRFKEGTAFARPKEGTIDQAAADNMTQEGTAFARPDRGTIDQMAADSLGITTAKPAETALDTQRFAGSTAGTLSDPAEKQDVKPEVKQSALKTLGNSVTTALRNIKTPGMAILESVLGPESNSQVHARGYFNLAGGTGSQVQRIAGNPATDLYAGANRNARELDDYGQKRLEARQKTIERKGYGPGDKFYDRTEKMKEDQKKYRESRNKDMRDREQAALSDKTKSVDYGITGGATRTDIDVGDGGSESSGGKSIVCTAMYQTTGLQDWSKAMKIWYIYQKRYLTIQHQEGYHKLFKPFVKGMHKSNIIKAIGAHFAKHRTQHLKHVLFKSKPSLLGKVYSKVLETICYWVGKI